MKRMSLLVSAAVLVAGAVCLAQSPPDASLRWFKGNTHTHTWWSDGDSPPELVVAWYKEHGYNFLCLSDHNILSEGEKWIVPNERRSEAAKRYEQRFAPDWIVKRERDGQTEYRLKPLSEFRTLFEEPGKFLLIQAEEISDSFEKKPIHVNGINLREVVPPPHGDTLQETLQNNIDAVLQQRKCTGQAMFPHVNHPNFHWALTPENLAELRGEEFFEVYNGHPAVHNAGDAEHVSTDRMWDIILTRRLAELGLPIMYGLATDDAHGFLEWNNRQSNPGRGWVMVRAKYLTPEYIIQAMERGDFYPTTGVVLDAITFADNTLEIQIAAEPGVDYTTQLIGTMTDHERTHTDLHSDPAAFLSGTYSKDIGRVLDEQTGPHVRFQLTGREIYARAKVISTKPKSNPVVEGETEVAWTQPVIPSRP